MAGDLVLHRGVGAPTRCRTCKAVIVFAGTSGGKLSPFEKDDAGNYVLENGEARFVGKPERQLELGEPTAVQRYTSHFALCPQSDKWRRKK